VGEEEEEQEVEEEGKAMEGEGFRQTVRVVHGRRVVEGGHRRM